jgi:hypothetical protein
MPYHYSNTCFKQTMTILAFINSCLLTILFISHIFVANLWLIRMVFRDYFR